MAAQLALNTPEILEIILRALPPRDLLLVQRTSRIWHGIISTSPHIQRMLFLRPDWQLEGKRNDPKRAVNIPGSRPRNNLLVRKVLDSYPTFTLKLVSPDALEDEFLVRDPYELSPDIVPRRNSDTTSPACGYFSWDVAIAFPADRLPAMLDQNPAISYEKASWRKMFLTQPPATCLHLAKRWQRAVNPAIQDDGGITMDKFLDHAVKAKEQWDQLFIGSDRDWHFEGPINFSHFEPED